MTPVQIGFLTGCAVMYVIGLRGVLRWARDQKLERDKAIDEALAAVGKKRGTAPKKRSLVPVNKGYRAWFMYRVLNATGLDGLSRFIWRRRRNAWFLRGLFSRFR